MAALLANRHAIAVNQAWAGTGGSTFPLQNVTSTVTLEDAGGGGGKRAMLKGMFNKAKGGFGRRAKAGPGDGEMQRIANDLMDRCTEQEQRLEQASSDKRMLAERMRRLEAKLRDMGEDPDTME